MTDQTRYSRTPGGTVHVYTAGCCTDELPVCVPVVVLDPSDDADVERLAEALNKASWSPAAATWLERVHAALTALLPPEPVTEPVTEPGGGAWAVVKDRDGDVWVRHENGRWGFGAHEGSCDWKELVARYGPLTVVREGVES